MTPDDIAAILARVRASESALGDGRDRRSDLERADYAAQRRTHQQIISVLMNAPADIARQQSILADLETRRAETLAKLRELEQEIGDFADWRGIPDARDRDREWERQWNVRLMLRRLHEGSLLKAPGEVYERLTDLEARIAEVTAKRDRAQASLDAAIALAEAMIPAPVVIADAEVTTSEVSTS